MQKTITVRSTAETEALGKQLGKQLRGGEVIELISDLGGGKTTLTRGLADGAGSHDHVSSPTFTISNLYTAKDLTLHHLDFYRLGEAGLMEFELDDIVGQPGQVVIVEWSGVVAHVLPKNRLTVRITNGKQENTRELDLEYPDTLAYLVEQI